MNTEIQSTVPPKRILHTLALFSGLAALSWQVLWQVKSNLALGISAWGTALTLATTMAGMGLGSLAAGHALKNRQLTRPVRLYGVFEILIGLTGLMLGPAFRLVEQIDTHVYRADPAAAIPVHLLSIASSIGLPAIFMGATLPVFGILARQYRTSLSMLYGLNTLGAAIGALLAAFTLIPLFGIAGTIQTIAAVNIVIGFICLVLPGGEDETEIFTTVQSVTFPPVPWATGIVCITGFATFALEVAWFRSLTAAFHSMTDAFAVMLAAVLISLGIGARIVPLLRLEKVSLGSLLGIAAILILLATPLTERFDLAVTYIANPLARVFNWFMMTFIVIGGPMTCLGAALPWILDAQTTPRRWGELYALNTIAAVVGSLTAGWLLLPTIGFAHTAWVAGFIVGIAALLIIPTNKRLKLGGGLVIALAIAAVFYSGVGTTRVLGWELFQLKPRRVLESYEGPDATTSAVEYESGQRGLIIDGFTATMESHTGGTMLGIHYMAWMGRLPMLLDPNPQRALVICFGTGQTADAVRQENPKALDIVDVNPHVFQLAHNFPANHDVLKDPRVHPTIMDGRAYIRRTDKTYDVITLEPMPPNFAGVNALYDQEFYKAAREKLAPHGVIAQWLPFHLVAPKYSAAIAKTFQSVFPNAILWIDPPSGTGILLGSTDDNATLGQDWPGFPRTNIPRDMTKAQVKKAILLNRDALARYDASAPIITDDNQLLAYGDAAMQARRSGLNRENFDILNKLVGTHIH